MPRVPGYDNYEAGLNVLPNARVENTLSPEAAALPGKQIAAVGEGISNFAEGQAKLQIDIAQEANALRVADAQNRAKEVRMRMAFDKDTGYTNIRGIDALERQSGKPLADEYGEEYKKTLAELAGGLGNDAQRAAFMSWAEQDAVNFHGEIMQHEGKEFDTYANSVHEGTIANSMNNIGLNYNNPKLIDSEVTSIKAATYELSRRSGKSATWAEARVREQTSKAHLTAISAAMQKNDAKFADDYLKRNAKNMSADDILTANGYITKELDNQLALESVDVVFEQYKPRIQTSEGDRAFNIMIGMESNGQQFDKNGQPLTSPAGAIGVAQVMPETAPEAAQLAGMEWDEDLYKNDPVYNFMLGKAYFEKQLQDFDGNLPKAMAAYNAGPGATRKAIAAAEKDGTDWLTKLPTETQNYVKNGMAQYGNGGGQYEKPTLEEIQNQVRKQVGDQNPKRLKTALDEAERRFTIMEKAQKQRDEQGVANAMRAVLENGGDFTGLAPEIRNAIPATEYGKVMDFAKKVSKGDDSTSLWLYNKMTTDPNYLKSLSDDQFFAMRAELSDADFKHFSQERAKLSGVSTSNGAPGDLNSEAIKRVVDTRLTSMKIDPTPKDKDEGMRVGALRRFINQAVAAEQSSRGKKLNDVEVEQFIDKLFSTAKFTNEGGWLSGPTLMKYKDIPSDARDAIEKAFENKGRQFTEADVLGAYWIQLSRKK